jgi:hypothetical protein
MLLVGKANGEGCHDQISCKTSSGSRIRSPGKWSSADLKSRTFFVMRAEALPATASSIR